MRGISLVLAVSAATLGFAAAGKAAEIRVISPGVISNSGLTDVAAAVEKKTGVKVTIQVDGMGTIMNDIRTKDPAADVVMLPMDLMGTMVLSGAVHEFTPLGRAEIGLFKNEAIVQALPFDATLALGFLLAVVCGMRFVSGRFRGVPFGRCLVTDIDSRLLLRAG